MFEIVRTDAGWHARFRADNGEVVWWTEVYTRRADAFHAVRILPSGASGYVREVDHRGGTGGRR